MTDYKALYDRTIKELAQRKRRKRIETDNYQISRMAKEIKRSGRAIGSQV